MSYQTAVSYQHELLRDAGVLPATGAPTNHAHYVPTSHDGINHDSLTNLGYDWSRVADPGITPRPPFKVYLPRTTDDVVRAVQEARDGGQPLVVRGHGHSSNDLVTPDRGVVLLTELMDRVVEVDETAMTVTMQAGARLMAVDLLLSESGLGLSIIGDHDHITAGGFASVGGISPASHRYGMFVDTVVSLTYVDWTGKVQQCDRDRDPDDLQRILCGTGRHGVITELTVRIVRVDKFRTVYANNRHITTDLNDFVRYSGRMVREPGDAIMERGVWADFDVPWVPKLPGVPADLSLRLGQFSSYHNTEQRVYKSWWNDLAYGFQHRLGYWAGRLPTVIDDLAKYVGMGAIMFSPRYAGMKNIERFTDQILDSTVGDPTRMFVVLAPTDRYETLFYQLYEACVAERRRSGAITFISVYVKSIRSPYLSGGTDERYCEIMLYLGVHPAKMTSPVRDRLLARIDRLVLAAGAFRYLHSLTSSDPDLRAKLDPNTRYEEPGDGRRRTEGAGAADARGRASRSGKSADGPAAGSAAGSTAVVSAAAAVSGNGHPDDADGAAGRTARGRRG